LPGDFREQVRVAAIAEAIRAVRRAEGLAAGQRHTCALAEGHALLARIHFQFDWDWHGTESEYKRAIELNPNLADTYRLYAYYLQAMSRHQEALAAAHHAVELDPVYPATYADEGRIEYRARQYQKAVSSYQHALELDPDFVPALSRIVEAYEQLGKFDQALAAAKHFQGTGNTPDAGLFLLARIYARTGRRPEAIELVRRAEDVNPRNNLEAIGTYAALGDSDRALTVLQKGINDRSTLPFVFVDPMLDPLRSDPRTKAMIMRVGIANPPTRPFLHPTNDLRPSEDSERTCESGDAVSV